LAASASLAAGTARAGDQEYPVSYVERPLTLPKLTLAPSLELDIDRLLITPSAGTGVGGLLVAISGGLVSGMQIGAAFGITDDLEVGAIVLPILFTQGGGYGGQFVGEEGTFGEPTIYGTYRLLHREAFDLGARLSIQVLVPENGLGGGAIIEPSVPLLVHVGKRLRFDAEVGIPIIAGSKTGLTNGGSVTAGLDVPLRLAFDVIEPLHVGVSTGFAVDDFGQAADSTRIPLGVFFGYAVGEKRPIIDIDPFFSFYDFITPGGTATFGLDKVNPGIFVAGINARAYIYL
jgi:hypothetical protein